MPDRVLDYAKWTYELPQNPSQKDYSQLSTKLKSYVESPKFLRQGSTIDQYDPQTGKRIKRPITNVIYRQRPGEKNGIPSQQLRALIYKALAKKDKAGLQRASKYHYFTANKFLTQKQKRARQDKERRKRVLLEVLAFGAPTAVAAGSLPFISAKLYGDPINADTAIKAGKLGAAGFGIGVLGAGLLESMREG